ncbi:MAG: RpiB/LacA/LacB family sugar-phosphate isomerase [Chloracidobacterium sp.]|nr:RpiB/LacA/LacB family sugar-phosphate isomerase [Chloracidobacterium sp.]MCO5333300.1 RpiB/LacA/LacB family sugar-phosphate isomerase [Pyrinomonadaceae bacterium]
MNETDSEKRDRVRELVRQVLAAVPGEARTSVEPEAHPPQHIVVNSLRDRAEREWERDESSKTLITENDLRGLEEGSRVRVAADVKFTPLASDLVRDLNIVLIRKHPRSSGIKVRSVAIGCDHGGFKFKEQLKVFLGDLGLNVRDFGTETEDAVDYPDFAHAVARAVSGKQADVGIIIDGAGIGSAMAANKVPGVRAAQVYSVALAKNSREHNGANILTLGSGQNSFEEVKAIVEAFLTTEISEERHKKRVGKIDAIDRQYRS